MAYADYKFYKTVYFGQSIPEADFNRFILQASAYLDYLTCGRITQPTNDVQMAACAVADAYKLNFEGGGIAGQTVGKWSVSYIASGKAKTDDQRLYDAAKVYLSNSGLLGRWL